MYSRTRGYLPHLTHPKGMYFITFRLADSLPAAVVFRWKEELDLQRRSTTKEDALKRLSYEYQAKIQNYLDTSAGHCWLSNPKIAFLVDRALKHHDHERYHLLAATIMPNHVHVLLKMNGSYSMGSIVHSWKSFTAHEANRLLNRRGEFWQREYFDRLITSNRQMEFVLRYILNNPVKAGLCKQISQWPWNRCSEEIRALVDRFYVCEDPGDAGVDAGGH